MSKGTVELDFFGMEKETSSKSQFQKFLHRQRSFRGTQNAISKINPELIKSLIDSKKSFSVPTTPKETQFPSLPVFTPISRIVSENVLENAPLTIFYNGTVSVFDVPQDKAECILKLAVEKYWKSVESMDPKVAILSTDQQQRLLETLNGDLPIARRKSLQTFLKKRKERLTSVSPYACPT